MPCVVWHDFPPQAECNHIPLCSLHTSLLPRTLPRPVSTHAGPSPWIAALSFLLPSCYNIIIFQISDFVSFSLGNLGPGEIGSLLLALAAPEFLLWATYPVVICKLFQGEIWAHLVPSGISSSSSSAWLILNASDAHQADKCVRHSLTTMC